MPKYHELIKTERESRGFSQKEIAMKIGVSLRMYQYYEEGTQFPKYATLLLLNKLLGIQHDPDPYPQDSTSETYTELGLAAKKPKSTGSITDKYIATLEKQLIEKDNQIAELKTTVYEIGKIQKAYLTRSVALQAVLQEHLIKTGKASKAELAASVRIKENDLRKEFEPVDSKNG